MHGGAERRKRNCGLRSEVILFQIDFFLPIPSMADEPDGFRMVTGYVLVSVRGTGAARGEGPQWPPTYGTDVVTGEGGHAGVETTRPHSCRARYERSAATSLADKIIESLKFHAVLVNKSPFIV
ncbi:hypothetical protein EJB05_45093, partial [Eragrostis curvula]